MKQSFHRPPIIAGFSLLLLFFSFLFIVDSWLLLKKSRGLEKYDELYRTVTDLSTDVVRLEYILDIYVIAKQYEDKRIGTLTQELEDMEKNVNAISSRSYEGLFADKSSFLALKDAIVERWKAVKDDAQKMSSIMSEEEALLVHNSIDSNTYVMSEDAEKLLEHIIDEKENAFSARRDFVFNSLMGSLILALFAGFLFAMKVLMPLRSFFHSLDDSIKEGFNVGLKSGIKGEAGRAAEGLNKLISDMKQSHAIMQERAKESEKELETMARQIRSLNRVTRIAGSSISQYEVFRSAIEEAAANAGADCAAVYLREGDDSLSLKFSKGFSKTFFYKGKETSFSKRIKEDVYSGAPLVFNIKDYPEKRVKEVLEDEGLKVLVCVPILCDAAVKGFFDVAFKKEKTLTERELSFLESIALDLGVSVMYADLFYKEFSAKAFFEKVIQQTPFGIAVFEKNGMCIFANNNFKVYTGCDSSSDFAGNYSIVADKVIETQGFASLFKKCSEGEAGRFVANYSGAATVYGKGERLSGRCLPLFDVGGDVSHVLVIYEKAGEVADA